MVQILNTYNALEYFERFLATRGFNVLHSEMRHKRHWFITVSYEFRIFRFYMVFQREPFHKFDEIWKGEGEALTINRDVLVRIIREHVTRLFWVLEDGRIYMENPRYIMKLVQEHGWSRETEKTGEIVVHIPIKYLKLCKS
jgi:hypothetical protein